jgi:P-type Ca2+ transporter type 2C
METPPAAVTRRSQDPAGHAGTPDSSAGRLSAADGDRPVSREWHALSSAEVLKLLAVDPEAGLSADEARRRLARVGPNAVGEYPDTPLWRLVLAQFRSLVVLLLLAASAIAASLGQHVEALAILAALLLNAGIGFVTEWRARISLAKLRALTVPHALVRREGNLVRIRAAEVVPGDLLVLEAGGHVPADARLVRGSRLRTGEAALTGESLPVDKDVDARLAPETSPADRRTMVYLGTTTAARSGSAGGDCRRTASRGPRSRSSGPFSGPPCPGRPSRAFLAP